MKLIRVGVLGCGNVGAPLVSLIERQRTMIAQRKGVQLEVVAVAVRNPAKVRDVVLPEGAERRAVTGAMAEAGIGTSVHFRPVHHFTWFRDHAAVGPTGVDVADRMAGRTLSLPLHAGLTDREVERVLDALVGVLS